VEASAVRNKCSKEQEGTSAVSNKCSKQVPTCVMRHSPTLFLHCICRLCEGTRCNTWRNTARTSILIHTLHYICRLCEGTCGWPWVASDVRACARVLDGNLAEGFYPSQLRTTLRTTLQKTLKNTLQNTLQTCLMSTHTLEVEKCILSIENVLASSRASIAF